MSPQTGSIEAEYSDGYLHSEDKFQDISPYNQTCNILNDIIEKRPEAEHGPMVRFSVFIGEDRHDVDWVETPGNARPIRYKYMERDHNLNGDFTSETRIMGVGFGYQYNDSSGKNHEIIDKF